MRVARILWLLLFLIPLGFFADRFCYINIADPLYHGLMWLHERLPLLFVALGAVSVFAAVFRYTRIRGQLRAIEMMRSPSPLELRLAFENAAAGREPIDLVYIDVPSVFCFTVFGGRVVVSRGFEELLDADEFRLVAEHEAIHIARRDPLRALLWHLLFAALIVPGFERLEDVLYARRERHVDHFVRSVDAVVYDALLGRFDATICGTPGAAFRSGAPNDGADAARILVPAAIPIALLALLVVSHVLFVKNLSYLQAHHC